MERIPSIDPVSGLPEVCLSLAVRYFLPDVDIYRQDAQVHRGPGPGLVLPLDSVFISGSASENLDLPAFFQIGNSKPPMESDIDFMWCLVPPEGESYQIEDYVQHEETLRPGYCYLKLNETAIENCPNQLLPTSYFHALDGKIFLKNNCLKELFSIIKTEFTHENKDQAGTFEFDSEDTYDTPAISVTIASRQIDFVPCLPVPWPVNASDWQHRKRSYGWPEMSMVTSIVNSGCHVVVKSHPLSGLPDIEWRYSFSAAEISLTRTFNHMQNTCYRVFKTLMKYHKNTHALGIPSYLLKTTFFWVCENTPPADWTLNNLGRSFLHVIDTFMGFLKSHELPHYFIPGNNLIGHIPKEEVEKWIRGTQYFRRYPLTCMADFQLEYTVFDSFQLSNNTAFCSSLRANAYRILRDCASKQSNSFQDLKAFAERSLQLFGLCAALEYQYKDLLSITRTEFKPTPDSVDEDYVILNESLSRCLVDDLKILRQLLPLYIDQVTSDKFLGQGMTKQLVNKRSELERLVSHLKAELACICFELAGNVSIPVRYQLCAEAEFHFKSAVSNQNCGLSVQVKYAQYLLVQKRYFEAFPILQRIVYEENEDMPPRLRVPSIEIYSKYTSWCVEEILRLIYRIKDVKTPFQAHSLAYYLLLICFQELRVDTNGYVLPHVDDYYRKCGLVRSAEMSLFEGCFLLRYGLVYQALYVFMLTQDHWAAEYYKWYCVTLLFRAYHAQMKD